MTISAGMYERVRIIGLKITPDANCKCTSAEILQQKRMKLEQKLLALEQTLHGRAAGLSGKCPYCSNKECARIAGMPCRHPDLARPSLEALGFNVEKIASDYLKTKILWEHDGVRPEYLLLVGAVFY